jgi:hypothetical protein
VIMINLKELANVLKNTVSQVLYRVQMNSSKTRQQFVYAMGESTQAHDSTGHNQQGQNESSVELVSDMVGYAQNHAARTRVVEPPLVKGEQASEDQNTRRRPRKLNQRRLEDGANSPNRDQKQKPQAQRSRYLQLKQDFGTIQAENERLRGMCDDLTDQINTLQLGVNRYHYIVEHFIVPYARDRCLNFDDRTSDTLDFVLNPMLQDAQGAKNLQDQVQMLQKELLAREKTTAAISDERFAKDFCKLAAQIKTLSRLLRPYENLNVVKTLGSCIMAIGVAPHHWDGRVGRKLFIEAWTWSILIQMIFQDPFSIFGMEGRTIANLWSSMFGSEHYHGWPTPSPPCESWRHKTMEHLVAVVDEDIITQGKTKKNYLYFEQHVVDARASVISTIETGLATITAEVDSSQVLQIVDGAFTLLMHMSIQQPRLQIKFPKSGDIFDGTEMKLQAILDEEDGTDHGIVAAIVNPGLMKWGDVHGKNHDHHYAIVPSLVRVQVPGEANI